MVYSIPSRSLLTENELDIVYCSRSEDDYITYGELLCILIYGQSSYIDSSGNKRDRSGKMISADFFINDFQQSLVEKMEVDDFFLQSCLYKFFEQEIRNIDLPIHLGKEYMNNLINNSSEEVKSIKLKYLNNTILFMNQDLGRSIKVPNGSPPGIDCYSFKYIEDRYKKYGKYEMESWSFPDKCVRRAKIRTYENHHSNSNDNKIIFKRIDVLNHYTIIAYDFETTTDGNIHKPYLCSICYIIDKNTKIPISFRTKNPNDIIEKTMYEYNYTEIAKKTFIGRDCAQQMVDFICEVFFELDIIMIAHNLRYDMNMLMKNTSSIMLETITKSTSKTNSATITLFHSKEKNISNRYKKKKTTKHLDSLSILNMKLADVGLTYDLDVSKAPMLYSLYNETFVFNNFDKTPLNYIKYNITYNLNELFSKYFNDNDDVENIKRKNEFYEYAQKAEAICGNDDNILFLPFKYARYYCELDVEVLLKGFLKNRQEMASLQIIKPSTNRLEPCMLDIKDAVSVPQYATHILGMSGCFDKVYKLKGILADYISRSVVGGRCMIRDNIPHECTKDVEDFDACSLYPSAMERIANSNNGGFPIGKPELYVPGEEIDILNDNSINQYYITVIVTKVNIPRHFPVLSYKDGEGNRCFSNDIVGKKFVVDKITWEDAIKFQKIEGEILHGIIFRNGGNINIGKLISYLYNSRKELKRQGKKAAQNVRKLVMNSSYGRTIMKPITINYNFLSMDKKKALQFICKHSMSTINITEVRNDFFIVERQKAIDEHYNLPHIGSYILSMSKRIMNEVMYVAEDNNFINHYQDTDSLHIEKDCIEDLGKHFYNIYKKPLIVLQGKEKTFYENNPWYHPSEELGLFHGDFAGEKGYSNPISKRSIYIAKKTYVDELYMRKLSSSSSSNDDNSSLPSSLINYHIRMKGVPSSAVYHFVKTNSSRYNNPYEIYKEMLEEGRKFEFDLLSGGEKVSFESSRDMTVKNRLEFKRKVGVSERNKEKALQEYNKYFFF